MTEITDTTKKRIIWARQLLKENAPYVFKQFANHKINKKAPKNTTDPAEPFEQFMKDEEERIKNDTL